MRPWMRLDNAALIFPATQNSRWVNTFRLSADLAETVDPALLGQDASNIIQSAMQNGGYSVNSLGMVAHGCASVFLFQLAYDARHLRGDSSEI